MKTPSLTGHKGWCVFPFKTTLITFVFVSDINVGQLFKSACKPHTQSSVEQFSWKMHKLLSVRKGLLLFHYVIVVAW